MLTLYIQICYSLWFWFLQPEEGHSQMVTKFSLSLKTSEGMRSIYIVQNWKKLWAPAIISAMALIISWENQRQLNTNRLYLGCPGPSVKLPYISIICLWLQETSNFKVLTASITIVAASLSFHQLLLITT